MEDNIFDEITADLRRDRMAGAWAKYGRYVIGLAVAIVMLVAGVIGYDALRTGQREAASAFWSRGRLIGGRVLVVFNMIKRW